MSEEELEQDELDGADEDDGEELAAADDGEADSSDGDEAPAPGKKAKAAVVEEELPSVEASRKSVTPSPRRWRNSFPAVERCRRSNPTWWPIRRRSRTASTAAAPSDFASSQGPPPVREWRALCYGALASSSSLAHPHAVPDIESTFSKSGMDGDGPTPFPPRGGRARRPLSRNDSWIDTPPRLAG